MTAAAESNWFWYIVVVRSQGFPHTHQRIGFTIAKDGLNNYLSVLFSIQINKCVLITSL
jgi:hypothetical protein